MWNARWWNNQIKSTQRLRADEWPCSTYDCLALFLGPKYWYWIAIHPDHRRCRFIVPEIPLASPQRPSRSIREKTKREERKMTMWALGMLLEAGNLCCLVDFQFNFTLWGSNNAVSQRGSHMDTQSCQVAISIARFGQIWPPLAFNLLKSGKIQILKWRFGFFDLATLIQLPIYLVEEMSWLETEPQRGGGSRWKMILCIKRGLRRRRQHPDAARNAIQSRREIF